jgi:hypothetical protein
MRAACYLAYAGAYQLTLSTSPPMLVNRRSAALRQLSDKSRLGNVAARLLR